MAAAKMVKFRDAYKKDPEEHFGILLKNGSLICMCCGGILKAKEYKIIQEYDMDWQLIDETLKAAC